MTQLALGLECLRGARRLGIYVHCPRLREVDTSALLASALEQGSRRAAASLFLIFPFPFFVFGG